MKKKNQVTISIIVLLALILGVVSYQYRDYTFERGFFEITELDKVHGGDLKKERVPGQMVPLENIDAYTTALTKLRDDVVKDKDESLLSEEEKALLLFIDGRTLMLLSEKNYLLGSASGPKGVAADADGFACSETGYLINTGYYYNASWSSGLEAIERLETVLDKHRNIPHVWDLLGVDDNKMAFFRSFLGELTTIREQNLLALTEFCFVDMSGGFKGVVNPQEYTTITSDPAEIIANLQDKGLNVSYGAEEGLEVW